jgi:signal transduction histidine kinase
MATAPQQATSLLDRAIDWFIPPELAAQRETRQQARMFLISHLCGPFLGNVVPGALLFLDPSPGYQVAILGVSITAFWVFPFLLRAFGHYNLLAFISVQNLIFCILWSCYFYGGVSSPTLPWVLSIPLLTFFYLGANPKLRLWALAQFAVNFLAFAAIYRFMPPPTEDTPLEALQGLGIVSTLAAAGYVSMMALYYARILASGAELEEEMRGHLATATELRRATAEAERAGLAKAEFVANMSHELRTPLNAVIGYSQMLLEEAADEADDGSAEDLNKIHHAGQHLLNLVNEVLDLAKIEAGKMELVSEEIAVADFLGNLCSPHAAKAQAKGVPLKLQLAADLGTAKWDGQRVSQALDQILSNAVKFTSEGSVNVTVSREPARPAHRILIEIQDTGIGIAPEMLPRLFETFTVAHDSTASKYGDTGLGLSLSLALCRLMGGQIEATSTLGSGSCFIISLPVAPVSARRTRKASSKTELDYDVPLTSAA